MQCKWSWSLYILFLLPVLLLHACSGNVQAPVEAPGEVAKDSTPVIRTEPAAVPKQLPAYHVVNKGDTLYSIAWNYGFDYRDVAAWNSINTPYVIYPGQRIQLSNKQGIASPQDAQPPLQSPEAALTPGPIVIKRKPGTDVAVHQEAVPTHVSPEVVQQVPPVGESFTWTWPTQGMIVKADTPIAKNGIDIAGKKSQQINASAPGEVVYSGSGLLGYGRLIIIKHNDTFLSAYAHNSELLVKEGDRVKGGQNIALMGETNNGKAFLHFEIRRNGQPIDPLIYLPKAN